MPRLLTGPRGTDLRLEESDRKTRSQKREEFHGRKDAQTAAREQAAAERKAGHWSTVLDDDDE